MALFKEQAKEIDIIITTAQIPGRKAPVLILKEAVDVMKPGSVIVDLAASTGGNCELTKAGEIYTTDNGVTIVGKLSQMASQASQLYGNNLCHLLDDMGKAEGFKIDMEDDVISRAMVTYNGSVNWPPKPLPVSPQIKKEAAAEVVDNKPSEAELSRQKGRRSMISLTFIGLFLLLLGQVAPSDFMQHFTVFVLSVFIGWQVIWNVSHSLHTPLMAVTNAISGIIVIGGLELFKNVNMTLPLTVLAAVAILVASINIVGGFFVTHRMLKMFKK
jgi:NAD(P) transhydrogenase subunit alpha